MSVEAANNKVIVTIGKGDTINDLSEIVSDCILNAQIIVIK